MNTDCLINAIGLSRHECDCWDATPEETPESGIYLDELEGLNINTLTHVKDCGAGNIWEMMEEAREQAVMITQVDLMACIAKSTSLRKNEFSGQIGDYSKSSKMISLTNGKKYGMVLRGCYMRSGMFKIKRIGIWTDFTGDIDVELYGMTSDTPIDTWTIPAVANTLSWFNIDPDKILSLEDTTCGYNDYWLVFTPTDLKVKDVQVTCGCGSAPEWNIHAPSYNHSFGATYGWGEYLMVAGVSGTNISDRANWSKANLTYGLVLDVELGCNLEETICKGDINFKTNPLAYVLAYTIRYKAGELLIRKILSSNDLGRYTMLNRETLYGTRNHFLKEYTTRIMDYLCPEMLNRLNVNNDCLKCEGFMGMVRVGILK